MKQLTTKHLKDLWVDFHLKKNHALVKSSSLVPENDASVLFTTAGMQPLVPYLLGQKHPQGKRLVNYQACIRTNDIESVGDESHLTFFEMLGRWSLGDYFKQETVEMSFEFLTSSEYLGIDVDKIAITVFEGDEEIPRDEMVYNAWLNLGIKKENIFYLSRKENWWALGEVGPCGTNSEMFYITDKPVHQGCTPACDCGKYLEIGNDVFMAYATNAKGEILELENKNIDTGMGLERNVAVLNGYSSVYETDAFSGAVAKIEDLSGRKYGENENATKAIRIIADHIRTSTMILGDSTPTTPSNVGRGYVLRRLLRRAIRYVFELGKMDAFDLKEISNIYINQLGEYYETLIEKKETILNEIDKEVNRFNKTLTSGMRELEKVVSRMSGSVMDGASAFRLYDTFGFPIELTQEVLSERGISVNLDEYEAKFLEHQEKSRGNNERVFKSGLAGSGEIYNRYHTATHLLHAVLREKFGESVRQAGSAITDERMRFDFTFERKLTPDEVREVELAVNNYIKQDLKVTRLELTKKEAHEMGALGIFDDKYGDVVTVYTIGDISKEFCSGPHVENTSEIGTFKITKEESSSAGVRRIKAIIE